MGLSPGQKNNLKIKKLDRSFYYRPTLEVARDLIGKRIIRILSGKTLTGRIIETEAYRGKDDAASHARRGITKRNTPMFSTPGTTYVYFIYGMHWLFNISAHIEGMPGGVLIRALEPESGLESMCRFRGTSSTNTLTNGPARLAQALHIDSDLNNIDLVTHTGLYLVDGSLADHERIASGPRVRVPGDKLAKQRLWRFWVADHPLLSR
ncbi:MAG: DNA-3-methyladenine glycosylase [Anaerolineae bacterium]|nr:DNA-3-methyladenine glycosylase [Anaerolineae bacterium]